MVGRRHGGTTPDTPVRPYHLDRRRRTVRDGAPEWALWLQQQRAARRWSRRRLAVELRRCATARGQQLPSDDNLIRGVLRWERGEHKPDEFYRALLAEVYDEPALADLAEPSILEDMERRTFLRNLGATTGFGAAAVILPGGLHLSLRPTSEHAEIASIRDALMSYDHVPNNAASNFFDLTALQSQVHEAWRARQASAYRRLGVLLPRVVIDAQRVARQLEGPQRRKANSLLAETYQCVTGAMAKIGQPDLAWIAADRGIAAAEQSEDPLMFAASSRMLAHALLAMGCSDKAQHITLSALTTLEQGLGTAPPTYLSVYGALLQTSAIICARQEDRVRANEFLAEATETAQRLGEDRNDYWTVFGPTNVGIHKASVLVELGDGPLAVKQASTINTAHLPSIERRVHHLLDVAQGYGQWRKDHETIDALLEAEQLAPQEVYYQPAVQKLVADLLQREHRTTKPRLRKLATRMGIRDA